ncbi:MAG: hypothetical protein ACI9G1_000616 [Pirellulaceae bacterium]|jgi:hypothetical protein
MKPTSATLTFFATLAVFATVHSLAASLGHAQAVLSASDLRDIDKFAVRLARDSEELHDEFHEHLERVKHAAKLEEDVSALEKISVRLHEFVHDADGSERSMLQIRRDTNQLLQLSSQIQQTVERARSWTRTSRGRVGISHMRSAASDVVRLALAIDRFLPVDTTVVDSQADRLETFVKELHKEFHEHLEGYEMSRHLDNDLESLERSVEHIHDLAHDKSWHEINLAHVLEDLHEVKEKAAHIETLFGSQSRIGVRTRDFIGIEHSRDALSDVIASVYLLEHMVYKAKPSLDRRHKDLHGHTRRHLDGHDSIDSNRPRRDSIQDGGGFDSRGGRDEIRNRNGDRNRGEGGLDDLSRPNRDGFRNVPFNPLPR